MKVAVDICCNDPDNGLFDRRAAAIQIYDRCGGQNLIELAAKNMVGPAMRATASGIAISNKQFPVLDSREWVGNWCWNRYLMTVETTVALFVWLHAKGRFGVDMADERLFNAWKSPSAFPGDTFKNILLRTAVQ